MSESPEEFPDLEEDAAELTARTCFLVGAVIASSFDTAEEDLEHLLERARDLYERKRGMLGTKSETRDLVGEILFARVRRAFRTFLQSEDARDEIRVAEWVLGAVLGGGTINEFAAAVDATILKSSSPTEYSFAGKCDFIKIEDVMQMLGTSRHQGRLSLEKHNNRIDVYFHHGQIAFLDPHHLVRRVLPGTNTMSYREITREQIHKAESAHARDGTPLFLTLAELGCFKDLDLRAVIRQLGSEVLFEMLQEQEACNFFYRQLDELPEFALEHSLHLSVTPILLDGNKRLDDWKTLSRVFPDPSEAIEPMPDIHAQIAHLNLGVLEIKLLSQLNGDNSPLALSEIMGLPTLEVYQHLLTFAREGAIVAPGGLSALQEAEISLDESMQIAFDALDDNEDVLGLNSALDKVLGSVDDEGGWLLGDDDKEGPETLSLDFLNLD